MDQSRVIKDLLLQINQTEQTGARKDTHTHTTHKHTHAHTHTNTHLEVCDFVRVLC